MITDRETWLARKKRAWRKLWEDLEIGYLDRDLLPLLILLNRDVDFYTTSSCSGRIVVMDSDYPWIRDETNIVFKSHIPITEIELDFIYKIKPHRNIWLNVTGPIIHIYSSSLKKTMWLLNNTRKWGFKHSGILHVSRDKGVFIELVTGIYLSQCLRIGERVVIDRGDLPNILNLVNTSLVEGKKRLHRLYSELSRSLPVDIDEEVEKDIEKRKNITEKSPLEIFRELCIEKNIVCYI